MKKLLVLLMLLTIFLSGCGICNLNSFTLPDDAEFLALVQELDTPEKIGNYMEENFEYEFHSFYALTPYELFLNKKGDCNDFSAFSVFIANYHGYRTYQIKIFYIDIPIKHWIAVFIENNHYSIINGQIYSYGFNTFKQIVRINSLLSDIKWSKYIVYNYWNDIVEQVTK